MEPLAQLVRRRQFAQPGINSCLSFGKSSRPEPVDQNARAVARRRLLVNTFDPNHVLDALLLYV